MQIDLAPHIEKLLFLHDSLAIPSFGGFTVTRAAASADYVGGAVYPPTKTLAFNENLTADDGRLVDDVANTHQLSMEDARRVVQEFVDRMQERLDQREIVTLPGIGRLYKNYVQKIQFLPDTTNFDPEAYGLPPLQFSPIARSRAVDDGPPAAATPPPPAPAEKKPVPAAPAPVASATVTPTPPPVPPALAPAPAESGSSRILAFFAVLLLLLAVALGVWWMRRPAPGAAEGTETDSDTTTRVTRTVPDRPAQRDEPEDEPAATPSTTPATPQRRTAERTPAAETPRREQPAPTTPRTTGTRTCILVVATLREQTNVDRLVNLLETNGYQVYQQQKGAYQVGIEFEYRDVKEIQDKIVALQKLTGEDNIWIKKK